MIKHENTTKYINYYNEIDWFFKELLWNDRYSRNESYKWYTVNLYNLMNDPKLSQGNIIKKHLDWFKRIGHIRNEIVHNYIERETVERLIVTDVALDEIIKYYNLLKNPPVCGKIFNTNVFSCSLTDRLSDIIKVMKNNLYTHIPVYDDNIFKWLITESTIVYWISQYIDSNGDLVLENIQIKDIMIDNPNDLYEFISSNTSVYDIKQKFEFAINGNQRLWALLITNLGKQEEQLLWIITAWDIPRIDEIIHKVINPPLH